MERGVSRVQAIHLAENWLKHVVRGKARPYLCSKTGQGTFFKSSITPMGLSDHHYVAVAIPTTLSKPKSPYWRFNSRLLQDQGFVSSFNFFGETWRVEKARHRSLTQWWDLGKVQIRLFCQQYAANST